MLFYLGWRFLAIIITLFSSVIIPFPSSIHPYTVHSVFYTDNLCFSVHTHFSTKEEVVSQVKLSNIWRKVQIAVCLAQ